MPDLFRLVNDSPTKPVAKPVTEEPFESEAEFESFVCDNPQLLGEGIEIVRRQVRCDAGIMDILAVDTSVEPGRCVIVELKNEPADAKVLLQTLRYASWAMENKDSVRLMLQRKGYSEAGIEFDSIRIIVAAPEVRSALVELSRYVVETFEFDFVEIRRFKGTEGILVTVDRPQSSSLSAKGNLPDPREWNWREYQAHKRWSSEQIELGRTLFSRIEKKIQSKGWSLKPVFSKSYIAFKLEGENVVCLERCWAQGVAVWFPLHQHPGEPLISTRQDKVLRLHWKRRERYYYANVGDPNFDLDLLDDLFETAYRNAAGAS